jgi:hypothetical protein
MDKNPKQGKLGWIVAQYREMNVSPSERPVRPESKVAVAMLLGSLRIEWARMEQQDRNG